MLGCCRYVEVVSMNALFSADLAAANGNSLDRILSAILAVFGGIVQVSDPHISLLEPVPCVKDKSIPLSLLLIIPHVL